MILAMSAPAHAPPPARAVLVGRPCRAHNVLAGRVVSDPRTGRDLLVMTDMNETTGAELILVDLASGSGRSVRAPAGAGSWVLNQVPGDRMVVGTFYDGRFMVFDLRRRRFTASVAFPGESYIWNLALGGDGRLYGGTYPGGKLGALDLGTLAVEDCGAAAPPNLYLRNVSALPDGRLLCNYISEKPTTRIYNPAKRSYEQVPDSLVGVSIGASWNGYFVAGSSVFGGPDLRRVSAPFPTPHSSRGDWSVDPYLTTSDVLWLTQGSTVYRFERGASDLQLVANLALRGGRLLAGTRAGEVVGVRGQQYFVLGHGAGEMRLRDIPSPGGARPTLFLRCDLSGRIWGGPHFGQTLFHRDPNTGDVVNTPTVSDHGGEVYDAAFKDGVVYAAAYAGGEIIRYDPGEPWDQWNHTNPRTLCEFGSRGYIRPTGGILIGDDGRLYSGWMARYGTYGGALAVTDPGSGSSRLIEDPLGAQAISGVVVAGGRAFLGSSLGANGLPNKKGEWARFGVTEVSSGQVTFRQELAGVSTVRVLAVIEDGNRVILALDGKLCAAESPDYHVLLPEFAGAPRLTSNCVAVMFDRWLMYGSGQAVVALDCMSGDSFALATVPGQVANVAADPARGMLFVSSGAELHRVTLSRNWRRFLAARSGTP